MHRTARSHAGLCTSQASAKWIESDPNLIALRLLVGSPCLISRLSLKESGPS